MKKQTNKRPSCSSFTARQLGRVGLKALLLLLLTVSAAQTVRPDISFNKFAFAEGETLELTGTELSPNSDYELVLTDPSGNATREQLSASAAGTAAFETPLDEAGRWELTLLGEGLDAAVFRFQVEADGAAAALEAVAEGELAETPSGENEAEASSGVAARLEDPQTPAADTADSAETGALTPTVTPEQQDSAAPAGSQLETTTPETPAPVTPTPEAPAPVTPAPDNAADTEGSLAGGLENLFRAIASVGWYSVIAMLVAIVALHLTLVFKYWTPQTVMMRRQAASKRPSPLSRFFAVRYYTFTEKLVLIIMLAASLLLASLSGWNNANTPFSSWQDAVRLTFTNPWTGLQLDRPANIPLIVWSILIILFLAWALFTVLSLFVPRPRLARNAPRSFMYHLLSVLIPGSGLADEMWGILLIVPWAIVGIDALSNLFGWSIGIQGLPLNWDYGILAAIYIINLAAVIVEFMSYRRRMVKLKQSNPELAEEFGMAH